MTLEIQGVSIAVPGRRLVHDLSLHIADGENWAVLGANGSGKSLLLHTLAGLRAAPGQILLDGCALDALPARARAQRMALLLQEQSEMTSVTVLEMMLAARYAQMRPWSWETTEDLTRARAALAAVDLADYEQRTLESLSGGERRRCAIAAIPMQETAIALWDEPTNHLDLRHQLAVLALIRARSTQENKANLCVLHDVNLAARYCSHALLLFGDGCYLAGPIDAVLTETHLATLYGCAISRTDLAGRSYFLPV